MKSVTFKTIDNNIQFSVKEEFIMKCPDYLNTKVKDLLKFEIDIYFHNLKGPAIIDFKQNPPLETYWINGKLFASKEDFDKKVAEMKK